MKVILGWIILMTSFIAAIIAATGVLYTHLQPAIDTMKLLDLAGRTRPVVVYVFVFTIAVSVVAALPWMWGRFARTNIGEVTGPDPWYIQLCGILLVIVLIDAVYTVLTKSALDMRFVADKWIAASNEIPEAQAIVHLWANLRLYCAAVLMMTLFCFIAGYTLVARFPWRRDDF